MFPPLALFTVAAAISSSLSQDVSVSASIRLPYAVALAALKLKVGGRLYAGTPWAKPCFSIYNGQPARVDANECAYVMQNYFNSHLNRSRSFGGYAATQYETCVSTGDECELDWLNPANPAAFTSPQSCNQGSISPYYIDVKNKDDVIAAFKFSKAQGVPIAIKNTGHDYIGRSSAPDSLGLWMHNLKYISHKPSFIPEGCSLASTAGQSAVTFGAGQQFHEIYQFANDKNLIVVGGAHQSVGAAGGWGQGGGHSALTPAYGMGADRTLQYKIVTPDGVFRTANACQNSDLFFALRGGGGGTFGVVLEATMMASPAKSIRVANINWPVNNEILDKVLVVFLEKITGLAAQGWGGYLTPTQGNLILMTPNGDLASAQEAMKTLVDLTTQLGGVSKVTEVPTFLDWFNAYVQGTSGSQPNIGLPAVLSSRLIPAINHETAEGRAQLKDAIMNAFSHSIYSQIHITTPFGYKGPKENTSVNPIWASSLYQVVLGNTWLWNSSLADRTAAHQASTTAVNFLRDITPGSGAYHNEADIYEPNHEVSFWGNNYSRLLSIKQKYDPDGLLDCWHCVGWKGNKSPRFKCYI